MLRAVVVRRTSCSPILYTCCTYALLLPSAVPGETLDAGLNLPAADANSSDPTWLPLAGLVTYAVAYALGMGPVPDILPGEVFPTTVKGLAVSGAQVSLTLFTFLVSKIYTVRNVLRNVLNFV